MSGPTADPPPTRRVLITGGTGSLGEAMVAAFAKAGYETFFQYHRRADIAERLRADTASTALRIDFRGPFDLEPTDFDVVVNNAGVNESDELTHQVDPLAWDTMLRINVTVPFLISRAVLPGMVRRGWGRIINIGSIYSLRAAANRAPYVASKHALSGLTKTIAKEYAAHGITCNEICPSAVDSQMIHRLARERAAARGGTVEDVLAQYRSMGPAGRLGTAEEVAATALYLADRDAGFINGVSIPVDGGLTA